MLTGGEPAKPRALVTGQQVIEANYAKAIADVTVEDAKAATKAAAEAKKAAPKRKAADAEAAAPAAGGGRGGARRAARALPAPSRGLRRVLGFAAQRPSRAPKRFATQDLCACLAIATLWVLSTRLWKLP
jgi:hypothetical protein